LAFDSFWLRALHALLPDRPGATQGGLEALLRLLYAVFVIRSLGAHMMQRTTNRAEKPTTYDVYIDESSQTKLRYLVIGGLVVPKPYADKFEAHIIEARGPDYPTIDADGKHPMKWGKAKSRNDLDAYKKIIDAFFRFPQKHKLPLGLDVNLHCIAVDMTKRDDNKYNFGDADIGFSKDVNCLCVSVIGRHYRKANFHLYPDKRSTKQSLLMALNIMNSTSALYPGESRFLPFQKMDWAETEDIQALQIVDIIIGAIAYKLNRHYEAPDGNKTKKALCDFILKSARIADVFKNTPPRWRISIFHRNFSPFAKKRR
jgi:Protein of unknown function (DUF3800)